MNPGFGPLRLSLLGALLAVLPVVASGQAVPAGQLSPPLTLTLKDALERARANSIQFTAAVTEAALARQDTVQARAALLPNVSSTTEYLYTEGNGTPSGRFIANNAVHEYIAQGNAHQVFDLVHFAQYRRAAAAQALARAKADIAARGLVVTVVQDYYGLVVAQRKYANTQQAADEAQQFLSVTQKLEHGGEVAHSDVIKAQLQANDRRRDLRESQLALDKARVELAVLLFPDFNQDFSVVDDLRLAQPLPAMDEVRLLAEKNNPDLRAAFAQLSVARDDVLVAWGGHLPSLSFDYWYGVDATHFAVRTNGIQNLGYAAAATLSLPIWDWGAVQSKVKQAELKRDQARRELSAAQRRLLGNLRSSYAEAATARMALADLRDSAELAAESLRLTRLRYQAGEATVLEVVDAQNTLTAARNAYDDGELRYRVALSALQAVAGPF